MTAREDFFRNLRSTYADAVADLARRGLRPVGFEVVFSPDPPTRGWADARMLRVLAEAGDQAKASEVRVIDPMKQEELNLPPPPVRKTRKSSMPEAAPRVTLRLRAGYALDDVRVLGPARASILDLFRYDNPAYAKKKRLGLWTGDTPTTIETYAQEGNRVVFPRGGYARLRAALEAAGFAVDVEDDRLELAPVDLAPTAKAPPFQFWAHQEEVVRSMIAAETCLVRSPTGSGKSECVIEALLRIGQPALVVVYSAGLLAQWVSRVSERLGRPKSWVGVLGSGEWRFGPITIGMQQTLVKKLGTFEDHFGAYVLDECHAAGCASLQEITAAMPARYRIGVSADEARRDGLQVLIYDQFGPVAAKVERKTLIQRGDIVDVEIVAVPTGARVDFLESIAREDRGAVVGRRWGELLALLANDDDRNRMIAAIAAYEATRGESIILFTDRVDHARRLAQLIAIEHGVPCGTAIGGPENRDELAATVHRLGTGELRVAVATSCLYQGTDIPRLSVGVVCTPTAGNKQRLEQQVGRLRRKFPGKARGRLYYLWDEHVLPSHVNALRRYYGEDLVSIQTVDEVLARLADK